MPTLYSIMGMHHSRQMTEPAPDRLEALRRVLRRIPGGMAAAHRIHILLNGELRSTERTRRAFPGTLFQVSPYTEEERYPELFDALADRLTNMTEPKILSFGCSTGEEVRAIRKRLPDAWITGIDANLRNIALARKADRHPRSAYVHATRIAPEEKFDAILAMAVFRRGILERERPESCAAELPFLRFVSGVGMLDAALKPGGWLAIWNAQFRFCDTAISGHYKTDPFRMPGERQVLLYGSDDRLIAGAQYGDSLFQKG